MNSKSKLPSTHPSTNPASEARIGFRVTNSKGEGVQAALGLEIVDQAVFALAEKQPGFAKVFFYLEQEMMKPRYEIHSVGFPEVISSSQPARRDLAARALFSAAELTNLNDSAVEFGRDTPHEKFAVYAARYQKRFHDQAVQLTDALERADDTGRDACTWAGVAARLAETKLTDPWGNNIRFDNLYTRSPSVRSAGPDGRFYNSDDLIELLYPQCSGSGATATISMNIDHNALNGPAVSGAVFDPTGAAIPGATVKIIENESGRVQPGP